MSNLAKKISGCCAFFLTLLCLPGNSYPLILSFNPSDPVTIINHSFEVDVVIAGLEEKSNLSSFDIDISYDHTRMNFQQYRLGNALGEIGLFDALDLSRGEIAAGQVNLGELSLLWDLSSQPDPFTLATLSFVGTDLGTADLWFSENLSLGDEWGEPLTADLEPASVEIQPVPEPGTLFLLGAGLIGLAGLRRKRKLPAGAKQALLRKR